MTPEPGIVLIAKQQVFPHSNSDISGDIEFVNRCFFAVNIKSKVLHFRRFKGVQPLVGVVYSIGISRYTKKRKS